MLPGAALALVVFAACGEGILRRPGLEVRFPEGERPRAEALAAIFVEETPRIARRLSLPAPDEIRVLLVRDVEAFAEALAGHDEPRAAAVAFPFEARVVVRLDRLSGRIQTPRAVAKHEIVHVVLGRLGREIYWRIPQWFHEGLAQRLAGPLFLGDRATLVRRAREGSLPRLESLAASFPDDAGEEDVAYYFSEAAVREVLGPGETQVSRGLWDCLADGQDFPTCFAISFDMTAEQVEAKITDELLIDKSTLLPKLLGWSGLTVFAIGSPIVVVAWARRRHRARRRLELLEKTENGNQTHEEIYIDSL